jgi:hypothetical protein
MYPQIIPRIKVSETINNPFEPGSVYGFKSRNEVLGRAAALLKDTAIRNEKVHVPGLVAEYIKEEQGELLVLNDGVVMCMDGTDFLSEKALNTFKENGRSETMHSVPVDSDCFVHWAESAVVIQ